MFFELFGSFEPVPEPDEAGEPSDGELDRSEDEPPSEFPEDADDEVPASEPAFASFAFPWASSGCPWRRTRNP